MEQNQDTRYGKMSQGHSPQTKGKILKKYLKKSVLRKYGIYRSSFWTGI